MSYFSGIFNNVVKIIAPKYKIFEDAFKDNLEDLLVKFDVDAQLLKKKYDLKKITNPEIHNFDKELEPLTEKYYKTLDELNKTYNYKYSTEINRIKYLKAGIITTSILTPVIALGTGGVALGIGLNKNKAKK